MSKRNLSDRQDWDWPEEPPLALTIWERCIVVAAVLGSAAAVVLAVAKIAEYMR